VRVAGLDVVSPSRNRELSPGVLEVLASPSVLLERVRSRGEGVRVQSVRINEGLEGKYGVFGTPGKIGGTGLDGLSSSG